MSSQKRIDLQDRIQHLRLSKFKVRLVTEKPGQKYALRDRIPGPVRSLGIEKMMRVSGYF